MDNWSALFDGQSRYVLEINNSPLRPDVLRFRGREALSEPFSWDIEFTTLQANIPPEQVLMKYASLRMRGGKNVHGMVTRLEWLSTSKDQSHYRLTLPPGAPRVHPAVRRISEPVRPGGGGAGAAPARAGRG
ncbi:hypothetical protein KPZU09_72340 [Klebsiella pneumoniae]|uniref:Uncharacterized protein n=1 Tax=Klebsiella pneumoniae TaxID=573 RepID=A0A919HZM8_KLEPN|nr:hypothetical protein KPZU09_72340 [Klebsiella pneumoniae]